MNASELIWAICEVDDELVEKAGESLPMSRNGKKTPRVLLIAAAAALLLAGTVLAVLRYSRIADQMEDDWNNTADTVMTEAHKDFVEQRSADVIESVTDQGITVTIESVACTAETVYLYYSVALDPERYALEELASCVGPYPHIYAENDSYGELMCAGAGGRGALLENGVQNQQFVANFDSLPEGSALNDGATTLRVEIRLFRLVAKDTSQHIPDVEGSWILSIPLPKCETAGGKATDQVVRFAGSEGIEIRDISVSEAALNFTVYAPEGSEIEYAVSPEWAAAMGEGSVCLSAKALLADGTQIPFGTANAEMEGTCERVHFRWVAPVDPGQIAAVVFTDGREEIEVLLGE